jgi:hypothetical protein
MLRLREALGLDFRADEFWTLSREEQRDICIALAERAKQMANAAPANHRSILLNIAHEWLQFAALIDSQRKY